MIQPVRVAVSFAAVAALCGLLFFISAHPPLQSRFYPPCLFHEFTGLHCPGCGGTRCLHALLNLHFAEAAHQNIIVLIALPVFGLAALRWWWRWLRALPPRQVKMMRPWLARGIAVCVIGFAVLRNLPWPPFDLLAPR